MYNVNMETTRRADRYTFFLTSIKNVTADIKSNGRTSSTEVITCARKYTFPSSTTC